MSLSSACVIRSHSVHSLGQLKMNSEEIKHHFALWRARNERPAWRPITGDGESDSYFGGDPTRIAEHHWPVCRQCSKPMQFFLQLNLGSIPREFDVPLRNGLLQLFYCSSDDGACETWDPFSGTHHVVIQNEDVMNTLRPSGLEPLAKTSIVGWERFIDLPHPEEHERLGLNYRYDFDKNVVSVKCEDPKIELKDIDIDLNVAESISDAEAGDKLGGWPFWVQSAEYPDCPQCGSQMNLLLQIDSQDNLPYMFGDLGCAHITQCYKHPDVLAFGWACG